MKTNGALIEYCNCEELSIGDRLWVDDISHRLGVGEVVGRTDFKVVLRYPEPFTEDSELSPEDLVDGKTHWVETAI